MKVKKVETSGVYPELIAYLGSKTKPSDHIIELLKIHGLWDKNLEEENEELEDFKPNSLANKLSLISSLDKGYQVINILKELNWLETDEEGEIEPFIIIGMHRTALEEVSRQLKISGYDHFHMKYSDSPDERELMNERFQTGDKTAFVSSYGVGGTGVDLTRANRILLIGLPWTDAALSQARDRVHRIGQNRPVEAVVVLLNKSVDNSVYWLLKTKGRASSATYKIDKINKEKALPRWALGSTLDLIEDENKHYSENLSEDEKEFLRELSEKQKEDKVEKKSGKKIKLKKDK